jgi:translation initiation factor 2-alpha kinase 3
MRSCENLTKDLSDGPVLLVKRDSQTIRAVEPRTGAERWNYSVAQLELKLAHEPGVDCHDLTGAQDDVQIKVIVPEGLVCALSKREPHRILWKHKVMN